MKKYAVIENGIIANIIMAEEGVDLKLLLPEAELIVEVTQNDEPVDVGLRYKKKKFETRQPYKSWIWDEATFTWNSPIPYPEDGKNYFWNDLVDDWQEVTVDLAE